MTDKQITYFWPSSGLRLAALGVFLTISACSGEDQSSAVPVSGPGAAEVTQVSDAEADKTAERITESIGLTMSDGLETELWASEELLADPVAIDVDNQGRVWATVTHRSNNSEFDIRGYRDWESDSMTFETVEDRRTFLRETLAPEQSENNADWLPDRNEDGSHDWRDLAVVEEEVVRLTDTTGDGRANRSQIFLRDFNSEVSDVLGGIHYDNQRDELFLGVAPHAWRVKDTDQDGIADEKRPISEGFGVHIGFSGHGMSGVTKGPDGRIYYGIGDIGGHITDLEGTEWAYPNQGVIVRSEPDGSNFEVFAAGVRNTHEFTFDKYGNLITVDNDGDHQGEHERLVHLIDGSDSGWRTSWQLGKYRDPKNNDYKVWMDEGYHKTRFEGQAAHLLPPIAPYHNGPTGMVYNPGTALSEKWKDHFFVVEFVGSGPRSGINAFTLEPKGASFELATDESMFQGVQLTGLDFGPDGALYASDWIQGWGTNGKGRIWKIDSPAHAESETRKETQELLKADFGQKEQNELTALLPHADMRVRQKAQFELVNRDARDPLKDVAENSDHQLARIHALWGLGQMARAELSVAADIQPYLQDSDDEVRAQAAKLLGDVAYEPATDALIEALTHDNARVKFFAAQALGRIGAQSAVQPLIDMLAANNDQDVYLKQAGAIALARIGDAEALGALADHELASVRSAAVVALRRLESPELEAFLDDENEYVVTDAARAINDDQFVEESLPALAGLLNDTPFENEPLIRRAINANLYVGGEDAANRLMAYAKNPEASDVLRAEAINTLAVWHSPSIFDRVTGRHRGEVNNDVEVARQVLASSYETLLGDDQARVREATVRALGKLTFTESNETLVTRLSEDQALQVRVAALEVLHGLEYPNMSDVVMTAMNDSAEPVRMTALGLLPSLDLPTDQVVEMHTILIEGGNVTEQQAALTSLANVEASEAYAVLADRMKDLMAGEVMPEVKLELIKAVEATGNSELQELLAEYESSKNQDEPLDMYQEALKGGDANSGMGLFRYDSTAQCVRCHMVGKRGSKVGPDLTNIGNELSRETLLEALVDPTARIASGYGRVTAVLEDGTQIEGSLDAETETTMTITSGDETVELAKDEVARVEASASGMPPMGYALSRGQLRDLVEYLTTLKGQEEELEGH